MTIEEKSFLDGFVESKDRAISDYNKLNTLFSTFLKENPPQEEWIPLTLKLMMYLRPETINTAFNCYSDVDTQIKAFSEIAKDFGSDIQFAFWSSQLAYCANAKTSDQKNIRDIILHLDEIIRHTENPKELIAIFRKLFLGAVDSSAFLPNFFSVERDTNEFLFFIQFALLSIDESSKMTEKQVISGTMLENWFKYGVFSTNTPADTVSSIIETLSQLSTSFMLLTQRNMKLEKKCTNQECRIETLQSSCDVLTRKNNALTTQNKKIVTENEVLRTSINELKDEKAGLEQMIEVVKAGNSQQNKNQYHKLAEKLAVYYSDCKEAMNVQMSAEVGEVLRDTLAAVFTILEESGIPLDKG